MKKIVLCFCLLAAAPARGADAPVFVLTLKDAEAKALATSPALAAAQKESEAAAAQSRAAAAGLFPRLGLEANYRYQDVVPEIRVGAGAAMPLGDNESYSVGPSLQWAFWDSGATYHRWKSAQAQAKARLAETDAVERATRLNVRLAYLSAQQALEQLRLVGDGVRLSADQYRDISVRQKEGAGSRLDTLSSHQELLSRQRLLRQAQSDLSVSLRALLRQADLADGVHVDSPLPDSALRAWPGDWEAPTVLVRLDSSAAARQELALPKKAALDVGHPSILALAESARAAEQNAAAARAGWLPSLSATARVSRDYPNGPIHETITQKTLGASFSWWLFEGGRVAGEARGAERLREAADHRREDEMRALNEQWASGQDQLRGLLHQEAINRQAVAENDDVVRITYRSYLSGAVNHLQVKTANLQALEARVLQSQIESQIAVQLAILNSLCTQGDAP